MTQFNVYVLLTIFTMYFAVVLYTPMNGIRVKWGRIKILDRVVTSILQNGIISHSAFVYLNKVSFLYNCRREPCFIDHWKTTYIAGFIKANLTYIKTEVNKTLSNLSFHQLIQLSIQPFIIGIYRGTAKFSEGIIMALLKNIMT